MSRIAASCSTAPKERAWHATIQATPSTRAGPLIRSRREKASLDECLSLSLSSRSSEVSRVVLAAAFAAAAPFRRQVDELSASATYSFGFGLDLTVWGRNLLDDRYITSIFDSVAQAGSISGYPNQPRTYGVAARFRF